MITPSYAVTATERVLPRMALDFTTGVLDPRVTVTRALNTATRINSSGFVEIVNANLPRFDYDPVTLAPKGLLIEEARTNLALNSALFTSTVWTKTNVSLTTGIDDPAGGTLATTLTATAALGSIQGLGGGTAGATYSDSIWIRRRTGTGQVSLRCGDLANVIPITVTSSWVRYTATAVISTTTIRLAVILNVSGDEVDIWGGQIEAGAFATSYIPTSGASTSARNADVVSMTGTNFSSWYNASEGAFLAKFSFPTIPAAQFRYVLSANDGTATNFIAIAGNTTSNVPAGRVIASSSTQASMGGGSIVANQQAIGVLAYKLDSFAYGQNGATIGTDATGLVPTVNRLDIGALTTSFACCHIQRVAYWPQRIINNEALAFSK